MAPRTVHDGGRLRRAWPARFMAALVLAAALPAAAQQAGGVSAGELEQEALRLVNEARAAEGLDALALAERLTATAEGHARDMRDRDYYAHTSPEGETPRDRYLAEGGAEQKLVAENIARCTGCSPPADMRRLQAFHDGWMQSPEHRANILARGIDSFGLGLAGEGERIYAVQMFAGPGRPRGLGAEESAEELAPDQQPSTAVREVNARRTEAGRAPVEESAALTTAAGNVLARMDPGADLSQQPPMALFSRLPEDGGGWTQLYGVVARCDGCGDTPTAADIADFADQWTGDDDSPLLGGDVTHLGFAMRAGGDGRKTGVAVAGQR